MNNRQDKKLLITAMGHYSPPNIISNDFFASLGIESSSDWIEERTGIKSRAMVLTPQQIRTLKDGGTLASLRADESFAGDIAAFAQASIATLAENFQQGKWLLICGTSVSDWCIPANACAIAAKIGLAGVAVDLNSACSSFVVNLHFARQMLLGGTVAKILVTNPERYSLRLNYNDRSSCTLFGDGSACAVLQGGDDDVNSGLEIIDTEIYSLPAEYNKVVIPDEGIFWQQGKAVQKFAITRTLAATRKILQRNAYTVNDINYFIGHQANKRMLDAVVERLELESGQHLSNVVEFGNQGAAGAPTVLAQNWQRFRVGDLIVVTVVGAGLTWGSALLRRC
ncbi:MAG: ketoacyl-ACP synthase III [Pseudomonadota bacterium]|nr:ketoacyl-ACP synthase III [Pseudomonadota bacterium]